MKKLNKLFVLAISSFFVLTAQAQDAKVAVSNEGFFIRNGVAYYIKAGQVNPVPGMQELGNGNSIDGRGVIKHADGSKSQLKEGEMADLTGAMSANKVEEHIELQNGKAVVVTNGIVTAIESGLKLSTGETIDEYGNISNGSALKVGEKLDMNGSMMK
jgi:hypothetical protein